MQSLAYILTWNPITHLHVNLLKARMKSPIAKYGISVEGLEIQLSIKLVLRV